MRNPTIRSRWTLIAVLILVVAACGDDDGAATTDDVAGDDDSALANTCPEEGCVITITDVASSGDELLVTWETNFGPDVARNHIHIYWDTFEADQVSSDAESRGVEQGDWVPTDANPSYTTEGAVSVTQRADSTMLCVTAADLGHVVLDNSLVDCRDVGELL